MTSDFYVLIRFWCPPNEADDWKEPRYVRRLDTDGEISWTVTKNWEEANYFSSEKTAARVIRGVKRLQARIADGWIYEILKVTEETVESNLPPKKAEDVA